MTLMRGSNGNYSFSQMLIKMTVTNIALKYSRLKLKARMKFYLEYPDGPIGQDIYNKYYSPPNPPPDIFTLDAETGIFYGTAESR